jgi:ribosomal subunit interface protein
MARSDALAAHLEQRAEKLERFFERIISCHVVVSLVGHHHRNGDRYHFSINIGLPGHELLVTHSSEGRSPESAYESADRAFDEADRQLEDWVRRQRDQKRDAAVGAQQTEGGATNRELAR